MSQRTPDQMRDEYVSALGQERGDQFYRLVGEGVQLHLKWAQYVTLFGTTPARIKLLNESAPGFWASVEDILWDDLLLHISRVTDAIKPAGTYTLTLRLAPAFVDDSLRPSVNVAVEACLQKCRFARDWRDRRVAHTPLELVVPLAPASRASVQDAIDAIHGLINLVNSHHGFERIAFEHTVGPLGDADLLLRLLSEGMAARAARFQRSMSPDATEEDLKQWEI